MDRHVDKFRRPATLTFAVAIVVLLVGGMFFQMVPRFYPCAMGMMLLLYLGSVAMVPPAALGAFLRFALWTLLFACLLNLVYELLHSVFYTHFTEPGYAYPELVVMLVVSAVSDGFIALSLLFFMTIARGGRWRWPWERRSVVVLLGLALVVQILVEFGALRDGTWAYNDLMPRIPVLGVGLTPAVQMLLLMLPTLWLADRMLCRFEATREPSAAVEH